MIRHEIDIIIARPVDDVFAFLTNSQNHRTWDETSVSMEPQEPGPWRPGLRFREVRRLGGRNMEVESRVADLTPGRQIVIESLSGPPFRGTWVFEPANSGTRLHYSAELTPIGMMRLLKPLIARQFSRQLDRNFARLASVLKE